MLDVFESVREAIELPLLHRSLFTSVGVPPPTGVLLHGPPGTGKTLLARSICALLQLPVIELSTAQLLSAAEGGAEAKLAASFAEARARAPSVLFMDEVDGIGATREALGSNGFDSRLLALLLTEMDGAHSREEAVLVLGATNRPEALDAALRRPGRFDTEVEVGVPSEAQRHETLVGLFARTPHVITAEQLEEAAARTAGFVGADLAALHRHAALAALSRSATAESALEGVAASQAPFLRSAPPPTCLVNDETPPASPARGSCQEAGSSHPTSHDAMRPSPLESSDTLAASESAISWNDVEQALHMVRPSALREVELRVPKVSWSDIGGQAELKAALNEAVQWPLRHPEAFTRMGIRPPRGVLLYGPPGCSKTLAAKALASESRTNFLAVKGPELFSKWVGESERAVAALFRRARAAAPAIIFFDEIDALAARRVGGSEGGGGGVASRVLAQLLHEMDGVQPLTSVLVVAATNRPDLVDPALLRPGRFDSLIHVGLPDNAGRQQILEIHTRTMPLAADVSLAAIAQRTAKYSGAELAAVCREAALASLEESEDAECVALRHMERALGRVAPRTSDDTLAFFAAYEARTRGMWS